MKKFKLGEREVVFDEKLLKFTEESINDFIKNFAAHYDYYSELHALANLNYDTIKKDYEIAHDEAFLQARDSGKAEKTAEALANVNLHVVSKHEALIEANYKVKRLFGFIRSMDKAYDSAREFCFNLRKELDKLYH